MLGRMPSACAGWHTCHMMPGARLGKDDAPRPGWDTKPPAASPTSRTERPHPVPFLSQGLGEQAGTRHRQIQTHRCTQRFPQACAPEKHRHSHSLEHTHTCTFTHPKKLVGTHHLHRSQPEVNTRVPAQPFRQTHPMSLSVVLKPDISPYPRTRQGRDERRPGIGGRRQKEWKREKGQEGETH